MLSIPLIAVIAIANNLKALCESIIDTENLYREVAGILFLGTPHLGLKIPQFMSTFASIVSNIGIGSKSPILKQLKHNSEALQSINMQFRRVLQQAPIRICSAFETQRVPIIGRLVSKKQNF